MSARLIQDSDWALVKERLLTGILKGMAKGGKPGKGKFGVRIGPDGRYSFSDWSSCQCGFGLFVVGEALAVDTCQAHKDAQRYLSDVDLTGFMSAWDDYFDGIAREHLAKPSLIPEEIGFDLAQLADKANMFEDTDDGSFIFYWEETEDYPETCIVVYKDGTVTNLGAGT